ncbi:MAG: reverse transcriptase domain-containing protein, partial [Gloeomargaritales cyanobacterium]
MSSLYRLNCFKFHTKWKPPSNYQFAPLQMIFTVKSDLRRKARLVVGGHVVDSGDLPTYASTVKGMSVRLLFLIAAINKLDVLSADIGNAFVNAYTSEKIYTRAGPEFGEHVGKLVEIIKALYGLKTSARQFHAHLADSLRSLGFKSTRFNPDVWYRDRGDGTGYDYICTHVDDLLVFAKDPKQYIDVLSEKYTLRDVKRPDYYLGNSFTNNGEHWYSSAGTYLKEAIARIEAKFGTLRTYHTPLETRDHPEEDDSPLLDDEGTRSYQMLLGMAQWLVVINRLDICFAVSSLSRFSCGPREGHLKRAFRVWGYLKQHRGRRIQINPRSPICDPKLVPIEADFIDQYPDAEEEIDPCFPAPCGS